MQITTNIDFENGAHSSLNVKTWGEAWAPYLELAQDEDHVHIPLEGLADVIAVLQSYVPGAS
jgi:hypothetical protein